MSFSIRHHADPAPALRPLPGLAISVEHDGRVMAAVQRRPVAAMRARLEAGHRAWVARLDGEIAAWGWVATRTASIGELGVRFRVPHRERYLWNFVTRATHRGRGIYPRLLQAIVDRESASAERFWIIHAPENRASGSGIRKAGFTPAGVISFDASNRPALRPADGRGDSARDLLGLPLAREPLAPCWRCARAGRRWVMFCAPDACSCDYQNPEGGCRA